MDNTNLLSAGGGGGFGGDSALSGVSAAAAAAASPFDNVLNAFVPKDHEIAARQVRLLNTAPLRFFFFFSPRRGLYCSPGGLQRGCPGGAGGPAARCVRRLRRAGALHGAHRLGRADRIPAAPAQGTFFTYRSNSSLARQTNLGLDRYLLPTHTLTLGRRLAGGQALAARRGGRAAAARAELRTRRRPRPRPPLRRPRLLPARAVEDPRRRRRRRAVAALPGVGEPGT